MTERLADRLRAFRQRAGLTQRGLAHRAGIDRATVQRIERGFSAAGMYRPSNRTLFALGEALGVPPLELLPTYRTPVARRPARAPSEPREVIRRLRQERGLSVEELAARVACHPRTIERYEAGDSTEPKGPVFDGIPRALGVAPEVLWGEGPHRFVLTESPYSVLNELELGSTPTDSENPDDLR
jgi:transcriptional regulator with XRE-family HTH domain